MDIYKLALAAAQAKKAYLVVMGSPGDGSYASTLSSLAAVEGGPAVANFDFERASVSQIEDMFQSAWNNNKSIVADGFERAGTMERLAIASGLERTGLLGLKAALVVKNFDGGFNFGDALLLVVPPAVSLPADISDALAKRRAEFGGIPKPAAGQGLPKA